MAVAWFQMNISCLLRGVHSLRATEEQRLEATRYVQRLGTDSCHLFLAFWLEFCMLNSSFGRGLFTLQMYHFLYFLHVGSDLGTVQYLKLLVTAL
jgi:hypothetical protein